MSVKIPRDGASTTGLSIKNDQPILPGPLADKVKPAPPKDTFQTKKTTGLSADSLAHVLGYVGPGKGGKDLLNIAKTNHEFRDAYGQHMNQKGDLLEFKSLGNFIEWQKAHQGKLVTPTGDKSKAYLEMPKEPEAILPERDFSLSVSSRGDVELFLDWHENLSDDDRPYLNLRALKFDFRDIDGEMSSTIVSFLTAPESASLRANLRTLELVNSSTGLSDESVAGIIGMPWGNLENLDLSGSQAGPETAKALASNSQLHKTLGQTSLQALVSHYRRSDDDLSIILSGGWGNLKTLDLGRTNAGPKTAEALAANESLRKTLENLGLRDCEGFSDDSLARIASVPWGKIEVLGLGRTNAGPKTAKALAANESLRNILKKLYLYGCKGFPDESLANISSVAWGQLGILALEYTKAGPETAKALAGNESLHRTLKKLGMNECEDFSDESLASISSVAWEQLGVLGLEYTKAGPETAKALAGNESLHKTLKTLYLHGCEDFSDESLAIVSSVAWKQLESLLVSGTAAGPETLKALAVNTQLHKSLRQSSIRYLVNHYSDRDENLSVLLSGHWKQLESLNLHDTKAGPATAKALAGNESLHKTLKTLGLNRCEDFSDESLASVSSVAWKQLENLFVSGTAAGPETLRALAVNTQLHKSLRQSSVESLVRYYGSNDDNLSVLLSGAWGQLEGLNLSRTAAGPKTANALAGNESLHKTLKTLNLYGCEGFPDESLADIASVPWRQLERLSVSRTAAGPETLKSLVGNKLLHRRLNQKSVQELVEHYEASDEARSALLGAPWGKPEGLSGSGAGPETAKALAGNESLRKGLKTLRIQGIHLSDQSLAGICDVSWEQLEELGLIHTSAGPETAKSLAANQFLRKSLKVLNFNVCHDISDESLASISSVQWEKLEHLILSLTKAGPETAKSLAANQSLRKSLKALNLTFSGRLSDQDIAGILNVSWEKLDDLHLGDTEAGNNTAKALASNTRLHQSLSHDSVQSMLAHYKNRNWNLPGILSAPWVNLKS